MGQLQLLTYWTRPMPSFALPGCVRGAGAGLLQLLPYCTRPTRSFAPPGGIPCWRRSTPSFALPGPEAVVERGAALKGDAVGYGFICCRWRSSCRRDYARIPHRNHRQAQRFSNLHRWSRVAFLYRRRASPAPTCRYAPQLGCTLGQALRQVSGKGLVTLLS